MSTTKKFKFIFKGMEFILPSKYLRTHTYGPNPKKLPNPVIDLTPVPAASVVKQYVKKKYPKVVVSATSERFSMGNAVNINLSDKLGFGVSDTIYEDVRSFAKNFQYGKFNGMIDMYEMNDNEYKSEKGTEIHMGVKFVSVENRPKFASIPDVVRMIREYTTTETYIGGKVSLEKAIQNIKGFGVDDKKINKALVLINS